MDSSLRVLLKKRTTSSQQSSRSSRGATSFARTLVTARLGSRGLADFRLLLGPLLLFHLFLTESLTKAIGVPYKLKNMGFVCQSVQQSRCHAFITKHLVPITETQITGHNDRNTLIQIRAKLKQSLCAVFRKRNEA